MTHTGEEVRLRPARRLRRISCGPQQGLSLLLLGNIATDPESVGDLVLLRQPAMPLGPEVPHLIVGAVKLEVEVKAGAVRHRAGQGVANTLATLGMDEGDNLVQAGGE